jgi:adenylate cyclase
MNYEELNIKINLADSETNKGNFELAKASLLEVLAVIEHHYPSEDILHSTEDDIPVITIRFETLLSITRVEAQLGNYPKALEYANTALLLAEKHLPSERINIWNSLGIIYNKIQSYAIALDYYSKILDAPSNVAHNRNSAGTAVNIGLVYLNMGDYDTALKYFESALNVLESLGETYFKANVLSNIATIYSHLNSYEKALEYSHKSLALHEINQNKSGIGNIFGIIGSIQHRTGAFTSASENLGKALAIHVELGEKTKIGNITGAIGTLYFDLHEYEKALEYAFKALSTYIDLDWKLGIAVEKGNVALVYQSENFDGYDPMIAEQYFLESITLCTEIGVKQTMFEVHKYIAEFYKKQQRWQEALEHYQKYITIKDEVQSVEAKKQSELMEQRRQAAEREKEIALAKATAAAKLSATTNLLHKVLPESISTRMIDGEENIADFFPNVSILFADIAGFTPISADMPAFVVIRFLNHIFREFDRIIKKHGCEKIKTIGDGYMAVSGAPIECADHAERITAAAFEMQETIQLPEEFREYMPDNASFGIRIGLHTGSVVAGVIGDERFVWDVYSVAVNTAARMESHGEADKIHVTHDFVRLLQNRFAATKNTSHGIEFVKRGELEIKGKGMMKTYFLERLP